MDERVRQLAIQSGFDLDRTKLEHNGQILPNSLERFARAIARDCAEQCEKHLNNNMASEHNAAITKCHTSIADRYGIK